MRARLRFRTFGLSILALGVLAMGAAGSARAENGACWGYINATTKVLECFSGTLEAKPVFAVENVTGTFLISGQNLEILCTGLEFDEGGQLAANGSVLLGRVKFTGCAA